MACLGKPSGYCAFILSRRELQQGWQFDYHQKLFWVYDSKDNYRRKPDERTWMMNEKPGQQPETDEDLLLDSPIMKLAILIWTVGIFSIAIVLAHAGQTGIGVLVLLLGAAIGVFAFWESLKELYSWLRHQGRQR
jgi:hypothetical protein